MNFGEPHALDTRKFRGLPLICSWRHWKELGGPAGGCMDSKFMAAWIKDSIVDGPGKVAEALYDMCKSGESNLTVHIGELFQKQN